MTIRQRLKSLVPKLFNTGVSTPARWFVEWARGGTPSASGEHVNEVISLGLTAYFACVRNISEDIAKLPLGIHQSVEPRGSKCLKDHPAYRALHFSANEEMSAMTFRETMTQHALGWHGGFAEIVRDGDGTIRLYPLVPNHVQRMRELGSGKLYYLVYGQRFESRDIFDLHGLGYDGVTGYVISHLAKEAIGNALAAQKFSGAFFGNGTVTTGVIEVPDAMSETAFKHLRESFHERHGGGANAHKPIILEEGAKWTSQTSNAKDSQMIEALQYGVVEVCRLFRMPPHKVQHLMQATFSNIESQALEYVVDCLLGWGVRWEQEVWRKLLTPREQKTGYFACHNFNMLLRGDTAARTTYYREMFNIGALSPNDIRDKEDFNPVEGGDSYFVNAALVPLDMAATGEHLQQNQPASAPAETAQEDPANAPPDSEDATQARLDERKQLVGKVANAHLALIERHLAGLLKAEYGKVSRAAGEPDFGVWLTDFYENSQRERFIEKISPCLDAISASVDAVIAGSVA